jgi:hypothetical protein
MILAPAIPLLAEYYLTERAPSKRHFYPALILLLFT